MSQLEGTSELAALMETQIGICDEMIALAEREQQALARFRPAHLSELLAAQDDCAERLARTQEALDAALRTLAGDMGLPDAEGRRAELPALLSHLPPEVRSRLQGLRGAVEERAYTLAVLNAQNALLVRTGLLQVDQTATVLASALGESRSYGAGGTVRMPMADNALLLSRQA